MKKGKLRHKIQVSITNSSLATPPKKIAVSKNKKSWKIKLAIFLVAASLLILSVSLLVKYIKSPKPAMKIVDNYITVGSTDNLADSLVDDFIKNVGHSSRTDTALVLKRCEFYRMFLKENFKKAKDLHIDFIGNMHWNFALGNNIPETVYESQKEVRKIIDLKEYDLVGWEMSSLDSLSGEALNIEINENEKFLGHSPSNEMSPNFSDLTSKNVPHDAVFGYWLDNQDKANIIGEQDVELSHFYNSTITDDTVFFGKIRSFVSYVALAKIIGSVNKYKYQDAAAVFGSYHTADFIFLARRLGIKMNVYDACHDGSYEQSIGTLK